MMGEGAAAQGEAPTHPLHCIRLTHLQALPRSHLHHPLPFREGLMWQLLWHGKDSMAWSLFTSVTQLSSEESRAGMGETVAAAELEHGLIQSVGESI